MNLDSKNIGHLAPDFAIPAGTQVVLTQDLADGTNGNRKKRGSVGVVIECPSSNEQPYRIRFHDESEWAVGFADLALRRKEIDDLLRRSHDDDFRPYIIYRCQVGSRAFGLSNDDSDYDVRGIFLPPADRHWSLLMLPEQLEFNHDAQDEVFWELEKFLRLALKANPNILETLWTPMVLQTSPWADRLRASRHAFLSKHLYKTYSGYVLSQFRRMKNAFEKKGSFKTKHAMHLIRLLYSGISALKTGEIVIDVSTHRTQLLDIRAGRYSFSEIRALAMDLDREFQAAFEQTELPDQPDVTIVDKFLIDARRSMVNLS